LFEWELNFTKLMGRKPEKDDKRAIKDWYLAFKYCSDALGKGTQKA
jgi:hypothetical protein